MEKVSEKAFERYHSPRHWGSIDTYNGYARVTAPCGDVMEIWLQVVDGQIVSAGFDTTGCGPSRASGSMATELVIGKRLKEASRVEQVDILYALDGLPKASEHCALLAADTLKAAIADYRQHQRSSTTSKSERSQAMSQDTKSPEDIVDSQALQRRLREIGYKLLVMSGKGGVGKSTVAANLALALAAAGKRVGLLDIDIHGPSIPRLMGLAGRRVQVRGSEMLPLTVSENLKVISIGLLLENDRLAVIWRGPMKHSAIRQFLADVAWGPLDYLVIDSPPGTGDEPLSVAQLVDQPAGALLVTTPQELAIADVRRSVSFCENLSMPVVGILENMSGMLCPHCGEQIELFKTGGGEALAREVGQPFLGRIPLDPEIVRCGDTGTPYVERFAQAQAAKAFGDVIQRLLDLREAQRREEENPLKVLNL